MRNTTWRTAVAVPAALSLAFGAALLTAGSASAAPATFTVDNPATGTGLGVEQGTGEQILFQGVGLPTGDTVDVAYQDLDGVTHHGIASDGPVEPAGYWSLLEHLADLSAGQTHVTAVVTALKDGVADPATTPQTDVFNIGAPFTVTSPADGADISGTSAIFTGTAGILGRIRVVYTGTDGKVYGAGQVDNGQSTDWTITTTFPKLAPGATTVETTVEYLGTGNNHVVNVPLYTRTIHFSTPPVPLAKAGLTTLPEYPTLDVAQSVAGIGFAGGGYTPGETLDTTITGPGGHVYPLSGGVTHPTAGSDGSFTDYTVLPKTAPGGSYTITVAGESSHASYSVTRELVGDPTITSPANHSTVAGKSFSISGTGTPGASILLILGPSKTFQVQSGLSADASARMKSATADASTADAASSTPVPVKDGQIVVGADGRWSAAFTGGTGEFTVQAYEGQVVGGEPVNLTDPSAPVTFTVASATAVAASGTGSSLAYTGSQNTTPEAIAAGLLMLLGTALTVAARRRRRAQR